MGLNGPIFKIFLNKSLWVIYLDKNSQVIHHSKGKTIKFYELNAKFGNYELSRIKWVLDLGSPLFLMTKYFFFSLKLNYIFILQEVGGNFHIELGRY